MILISSCSVLPSLKRAYANTHLWTVPDRKIREPRLSTQWKESLGFGLLRIASFLPFVLGKELGSHFHVLLGSPYIVASLL